MADATAYIDATPTTGAAAVRSLEVPLAGFYDGMSIAGSNANGIGINMDGGAVDGSNEQFTLLDQFEAVRVPQDSSYIGNTGLGDGAEGAGTTPILAVEPAPDNGGDGTVNQTGTANLQTLAAGWVNTAV
jgi:hypothetical protein